MKRRFQQVDVFSSVPYHGNPVAVVLDADGLTTREMQRFARWTNLSETTFVLPPTLASSDYRVRIFTPSSELPFAGHPTIGTCHAWLGSGAAARAVGRDVVQECGAGLIRVRAESGRLAFAAPPLVRSGRVDEETMERIAAILRVDRADLLDGEWVDNGPGWVAVLLASADAVLAVRPGLLDGLYLGVVGLHAPDASEAIEVRAFFPVDGATVEDPVTGSLNASVAAWLTRTGRVSLPYVARQGSVLERAGLVHLAADGDGTLWVGGDAVTCIEGVVEL